MGLPQSYTVKQNFVFLAKYDGKIISCASLGKSHDLQNLGSQNPKRLTRVLTIQHDAEGGVLDC